MIRLEDLTKAFAGRVAVDHLNLEVGEGELCVLVGPSGCGKTTTLKMVNRLVEPTGGRILIGGQDVTHGDVVQLRRRIGYVIQQVGLFPHQTIADNVATVPRLLGWSRARTTSRVEELLGLVGLDPGVFAGRYPHELSGGQRQRVGVARALGADPPVLLMDEPFGAIDPVTRGRLQQEFLRLQAALRKTVVFVTHDVEEAVTLGDRIAVLRQGGVLEQYDRPAEVLARPTSPFVADFLGADRSLKRLGVTSVEEADLHHPPVLSSEDTLAQARRSMAALDSQWAVVVGADGRLEGYVRSADTAGEGNVGLRARPAGGAVPLRSTLKVAWAELLQRDTAWVAVADAGRYLGVLTPQSLHAAVRRSLWSSPDEARVGARSPDEGLGDGDGGGATAGGPPAAAGPVPEVRP